MNINMAKTLQEIYIEKTTEREDAPVLNFLKSLDKGKNYKYLEVGAGTGRFPLLAKSSFKNLEIECLEINQKLSGKLVGNGLKTTSGSVLNMPFQNDGFDIVHCSHLIEHFGYPDITKVLDELFRVVKAGGYVIIRTPLMHPNFYADIDHIRPYPLRTLIQYTNTEEQQRSPNFKAKLLSFWNRHWAPEFRNLRRVNKILQILWMYANWPKSKANGYVAIFKKI